jgi:hypothetical protein
MSLPESVTVAATPLGSGVDVAHLNQHEGCADGLLPSRTASAHPSTQLSIPRNSWVSRVVAGLFLMLVGIGAVLFAFSSGSDSGVRVIGSALSAVSLLVAGVEGVGLVRTGARSLQNLALFPIAGVVTVSLAVVAAAMTSNEVVSAWLIGQAPLLCGTMLVLRGLAMRSASRLASSSYLLFPESAQPRVHVESGKTLSLTEGLVVPADARIESGSCSVLERYLSPLPTFRIKDEGETVLGGSVVLAGSAEALTLSSSNDSVLMRVESLVAPHVAETERTLLAGQQSWIRSSAFAIAFLAIAVAISWDKRSGYATDVLLGGGLTLFIGAVGYLIEIVQSTGRTLVRGWARAGIVSTNPASIGELGRMARVLVDPSSVDFTSVCEVRELELLDDRIGKEALCGCVASLLGRCDDVSLVAAGDYCQRVLSRVVSERVLDLREYEGRGVCGSVKGVEISIGSEDFIVERGIMLQPSDIVTPAADERVLLVAIDNDVIARFWLHYGQSDLVSESVVSPWPTDVKVCASTGVQGEITPDTLLIRGKESEVLGRSAVLEVARFSGERFELPKATFVTLSASLRQLPGLLDDLRSYARSLARLRLVIAGIGVVCLVAFLGGLLSALVPAVVFGTIAVFLSL